VGESRFRVIEAVTPAERAAAFSVRYQVFVEELGYRVASTDKGKGLTDPEDDKAFIVNGYDGDVPVGTIAVDWWRDTKIAPATIADFHLQDFADPFGGDAIFILRKAAVTRAYRKTTLFMNLVGEGCDFVLSQPEARFVFVETAPYLTSFYERLGFRRYAPHFASEDSGALAVPMCLVINDHEYLKRLRYPMLGRVLEHRHPHEPEVQRYFHQRWMVQDSAPSAEPVVEGVIDPPEEIGGALDPRQVALFEGVDDAHVRKFLAACTVVQFRPKDVLMVAHDPSTDLYLITRGHVEIMRAVGGRGIAVATRGPGDLIGEMSMLLRTGRANTVIALTDVEAILIPEAVLGEALGDSAVVAQVNLNLAKILARRLRLATA
jgi:hypothetical protein